MNTSFLPAGMLLPTGAVTVMPAGRVVARARTALAGSRPELAVLLVVLELLELLELLESLLPLEPHPATATSAATTAKATAPRRYRLRADVSGNICTLLLVTLVGGDAVS